MIVINIQENENLEKLKKLAKEIANNEKRWEIVKEIDNMIDFEYDWIHFDSVLACRRINTLEYTELLKKLEDKDLLKLLRKYTLEFIFNKN